MPPSFHGYRLLTAPNVVTAIRPVCIGPFLWLCVQVESSRALWIRIAILILFGVIASSDLVDGWLARRLHQSTSFGRWFDHGCDVGFILITLGFFVTRGLVPWWFPVAIAWAFGLYVVRSICMSSGPSPAASLGSRLGHIGGVLYFSSVGLVTIQWCTTDPLIPQMGRHVLFTLLALLALGSGLDHLMGVWRYRRDEVP